MNRARPHAQRSGCARSALVTAASRPLPPLLGVRPGLLCLLGAPGRLGLGGLLLVLLGAGGELLGARLRLRVGPVRPLAASRTFFSTARSRRSRSERSRGILPNASHLSVIARSAARAASWSEVSICSASRQQRLLGLAHWRSARVAFGGHRVARREERVLGGLEPLPQRVVDVLGGAAGGLPLGEQAAERARWWRPSPSTR